MRPFLLLALLVLLGACATHPGKVDQVRFAADARPVTATTEAGALRGVEGNGVRAFLGVPYAAPPVGDRRWRAPGAVEAREATGDRLAPEDRLKAESRAGSTLAGLCEKGLAGNPVCASFGAAGEPGRTDRP